MSNYVTENSPLDREALKRGTSVYLVDRVIPLLPHKLSNGLCSLNAGVDRLALSCIMEIDEKGKVIGHKIAETVVNIDRRMTYTAVNKILTYSDEETCKEYEELVPMFKLMEELAEILREKRRARGSIDFDFPESKIYLDEKGFPVDILPYERNVATKIIEDFMLIANETVAEDFFWQELPFVYRTHDNPDPEKMLKLGTFISNFGYGIKTSGSEVHPKEIQKLLAKIAGTPEEAMISRLALRSMKQAKYTIDCSGHFGLACQYYCHFTSPIRRYPDLQIHRIIKEQLRGRMNEKRIGHYQDILPEVAKHSSEMERRAEEAERLLSAIKRVGADLEENCEQSSKRVAGITEINESLKANVAELKQGSENIAEGTKEVSDACTEAMDQVTVTGEHIVSLNEAIKKMEEALAQNSSNMHAMSVHMGNLRKEISEEINLLEEKQRGK